jgi:hypothetical protein
LAVGTTAAPGAWLEVVELRGQGLATASAQLQTWPASLTLASRPGQATPPLLAWVENAGASPLHVHGFVLQGAGLALTELSSEPAAACPAPPFTLAPAERCAVALRWDGSAAAASGGTLQASTSAGPAAWPITLTEDPAQTSNAGTGGGSVGAVGWLLGLLAITGWLARERRRLEHERRSLEHLGPAGEWPHG